MRKKAPNEVVTPDSAPAGVLFRGGLQQLATVLVIDIPTQNLISFAEIWEPYYYISDIITRALPGVCYPLPSKLLTLYVFGMESPLLCTTAPSFTHVSDPWPSNVNQRVGLIVAKPSSKVYKFRILDYH